MEPESAPLILAVDHNRHNLELLAQFLTQDGYRILAATNMEELGRVLSADQPIELALVDISGFDRDIWRHCECLRQRRVPFLVLASRKEAAGIQYRSFTHGARDVLIKPMNKEELRLILQDCCKHRHEPDSVAIRP